MYKVKKNKKNSIISYVVLHYFSTSVKKIYSKNPRFNEKRLYMVVIYYVSDLICVSKIRKLPFSEFLWNKHDLLYYLNTIAPPPPTTAT